MQNSSVPRPKSPPELYGRRREMAKVQRLEREIGFLEEELRSVEGLQLASRSCKEVADYVAENADPFIPTAKKIRRSCSFWKCLCGGLSRFKVSWICCCLKMPSCGDCAACNTCTCCRMPKCPGCCFPRCDSKCFETSGCCSCSVPKCLTCSSCTCCPKCIKVKNMCSCCHKSSCCCCPCYFCYLC